MKSVAKTKNMRYTQIVLLIRRGVAQVAEQVDAQDLKSCGP